MEAQKILIKKYENRRLYDTTNSRYVNLEEVAQMIRDGVDVKVVDAASGEDLTRLVLTQIIVEDAKAPNSAFPLDILRQMVVASGRVSQESFLRYMRALADMYQNTYRTFVPAMTPFDFMQSMMPSGARPRYGGSATPSEPPPAGPGPEDRVREQGPTRGDQAEVDELRRRIEELEKLIASGDVTGKRRGGTKRRGER